MYILKHCRMVTYHWEIKAIEYCVGLVNGEDKDLQRGTYDWEHLDLWIVTSSAIRIFQWEEKAYKTTAEARQIQYIG